METRARLVMVGGRLPEPELNQDLRDDLGGCIVRPDFMWREQRVIAEYEGKHHRINENQWLGDLYRNRSYERNGWSCVLLTADDVLRFPEQMVQMLADRLGLS